MQGWESENADLDLVEIINQILTKEKCVVGMNRDLIFGNQRTIYRQYKNSAFHYVFEVNRNEAGYNARDVHG